MLNPILILITGAPASGKTTLGELLSSRLNVPLFSKDFFKERLFEAFGCKDRTKSMEYGRICTEILWAIAETELKLERSIILESNFIQDFASKHIQRLQSYLSFELFEIFCTAPENILIERFTNRINNGFRHPGHNDSSSPDSIKNSYFSQKSSPLGLSENVLEIDTTNLNPNAQNSALNSIEEKLGSMQLTPIKPSPVKSKSKPKPP